MRWRWDTPADRRQFAAKLRGWVSGGLRARPAGRNRWTLGGAAVAVSVRRGAVTLALAPPPAMLRLRL
jgi:hypothetical protein